MNTIREIAAIAGVSRSTVSLVLNNSPLVKAETREKVLAVIQDTGYVPNSNARNLSWRATKIRSAPPATIIRSRWVCFRSTSCRG